MNSAPIHAELWGPQPLPLRPAEQVMQLERLGAMHQSRLSFMRSLIRRIMRERWQISPSLFALDEHGYGEVIYRIQTPRALFSFVVFSAYLAPEQRNDRVIATQWDLTMALVAGDIDASTLQRLRDNVPKQEEGRLDANVLVLSRANRSARNFDKVVAALAAGQQPDPQMLVKVGYLYRTTAVYGSGKMGMADWEKIQLRYPDFARPFAAEMFVCFLLRSFSLAQAEHIARQQNPQAFTPMNAALKRYIGIGNSTGLGMAPYLINHPQLINRWMEMRELGLARVKTLGEINPSIHQQLQQLLQRCHQHIEQTFTEDEWQSSQNQQLLQDLTRLQQQCQQPPTDWQTLLQWSEQHCSLSGQELLISIALELYPALVDPLDEHYLCAEHQDLDAVMPLAQLVQVIEQRYAWALAIDFNHPGTRQTFWYRSEEKMEPRLGHAEEEEGQDKQMALGIAYAVRQCYDQLGPYLSQHPDHSCARFLVTHPQWRGIIRRIQSMNLGYYGDIQANLLDADILPMHMLRAKLAFFGVSKFDPRSRLWVRNTMFQGAPLLEDIGQPFSDDWFMPLAPALADWQGAH